MWHGGASRFTGDLFGQSSTTHPTVSSTRLNRKNPGFTAFQTIITLFELGYLFIQSKPFIRKNHLPDNSENQSWELFILAEESLDAFVFADAVDDIPETQTAPPWKIMVVDDEQQIHDVTRLALDGFSFSGRPLEFISAHTGAEAKELIRDNPDTALILLDAVMETDDAGLQVAKYVREEIKNKSVRIVLRTGQPGQAPERSVITDYDINDYKEKTELTAQKLFTLMYSSLRGYQDIMIIEANKRGLEEIITASATIFELQSMQQFTQGVLEQLSAMLHLDRNAVYCQSAGLAATHNGESLDIVAGTGEFQNLVGQNAETALDSQILSNLQNTLDKGDSVLSDDHYIGYFKSRNNAENLLYVSNARRLGKLDQRLIEIFNRNVSIAFENIYLKQEIEDTQRDVVYRLGEAVETRSMETGNHVKRVAEYSRILGLQVGMSDEEAEIVRLASPLHDVGKIAIPDAILNKPGKLTPDEWDIMRTHTTVGFKMLSTSERRIFQAGAIIANEHHEKWTGGGYPNDKSGADIHIYGRIVALADVFDALGSDRCYKKAWELEKVLDFLREQRGVHFDPELIDGFFAALPKVLMIRDEYADAFDEDASQAWAESAARG
jgi:response regulator RpfG family c-di-GMP phosphodiesterase